MVCYFCHETIWLVPNRMCQADDVCLKELKEELKQLHRETYVQEHLPVRKAQVYIDLRVS